MPCNWDYRKLKTLLERESFPSMIVDLDCLDENISNFTNNISKVGKKIRIASKSIRVPDIVKYIQKKGGPNFHGLMCYSMEEAKFLTSLDFDDLLIAYPTFSFNDIEIFFSLTQSGKNVVLMIDCIDHIKAIEKFWTRFSSDNNYKAKVCIDVDMSYRPAGLHLGVYRSPIRTFEEFKKLFEKIRKIENIEISGIMGYEAQIAGVGDKNPFSPMLNPAKQFIKYRSTRDVYKKRHAIHNYLIEENYKIDFYNGGGSGSLLSTSQEPWITEVTVGSGFLQSHLFDYYKDNTSVPAFCFALQVTRNPEPGYYTCKSGGFIASGETSLDKSPVSFLPEGMKMVGNEGFGEVQTPVKYTGSEEIHLGDPLFFRPAKAGEIAERFREYILIRNNEIIDRVPTYRGLDLCFY
jgi:D-serine deaminase-like pyridoxal phosphate-dependent protein